MRIIRKRFTVITFAAIIISIFAAGIVSKEYFMRASKDYLYEVMALKCSNICKDINAAGGDTRQIGDYIGKDAYFSEAAVFVADGDGVTKIYPVSESGSSDSLQSGSLSADPQEQLVFDFDQDGKTYIVSWNYLKNGSRLFLTLPYSWSRSYWLSFVFVFSMIAMFMAAVIALAYEKITLGVLDNLSDIAYKDTLTSVRNKSAFDEYISKMEKTIGSSDADRNAEFAIGYFDCNSLKEINDTYGHDKGDLYLKTVCSYICHMFMHSPVFRIGGDEFICILKNDDYKNREAILAEFDRKRAEINASAANDWDKIDVACGIAVYDPGSDKSVEDVFRRADALMYEDKQRAKSLQAETGALTDREMAEE